MKNTMHWFVIAAAVGVCGCQPKAGGTKGPGSSDAAPEPARGGSSGTSGGADDVGEASDGTVALRGEWSLAERSTWDQIYADRMQDLNLMNTTCGSEITMSFDHESFRDRLTAVDANRGEDWSVSALIAAIRNVCLEGAIEKTTVATKVSSIEFVRAPGKKHGLRGRALTVVVDLDANPRAWVYGFSGWLRSAL